MKSLTVAATLVAALGVSLGAQKNTPMKAGSGGSEHLRSEWTVDGATIAIEYGRPALKGRVPGKDIDPFEGKEWRTGADEQTTLVTNKALKIGTLTVPAGTYGLHTIPVNGTWQLIVSKRPKGWGIPYPAGEDLGRLIASRVKQLADAEEELGPLRERGLAPGGEGGACRLDGRVHLLGGRKVDGAGLAPGRRVVDGAAQSGAALDPVPADPMRDPGGAGRVDGLGHAE